MNPIDKLLNNITMYRLLVYALGTLATLSVMLAFFGQLSSSPLQLIGSLFLLVTAAYLSDRGFGRLFNTPTNMESSLISALILFLIVEPAHSFLAAIALVLAGALSSISKFLIAWNGRHLFNPAAFAATVLSLTGLQEVSWWIGSSLFWPVALLLGLAIVYKVRRFGLFTTFVAVGVGLQCLLFWQSGQLQVINIIPVLISSPLIFFSAFMLTEPATMPPTRNWQLVFAALVAVLYVTAPPIGPFVVYPEVALLVGNLFAFLVSPKLRVRLTLTQIQKISDRVYNYVFLPEHRFRFLPGQHMQWTLPRVPYDSRGNRRTFTIASSPTESTVQLGVKFYQPTSKFKAAFGRLKPGDEVFASQLGGNFTLQGNQTKKLAFIAGGIGITPFRSMVQYIVDNHIQADIVLLYAVSDPQELAYDKTFKAAAKYGVRTVPVVTNSRHHGPHITAKLNTELIAQTIPDYSQRICYISGPDAMVTSTKQQLRSLGVARRNIKTDHFSGY